MTPFGTCCLAFNNSLCPVSMTLTSSVIPLLAHLTLASLLSFRPSSHTGAQRAPAGCPWGALPAGTLKLPPSLLRSKLPLSFSAPLSCTYHHLLPCVGFFSSWFLSYHKNISSVRAEAFVCWFCDSFLISNHTTRAWPRTAGIQ